MITEPWAPDELVALRRRSRLLAPCWELDALARQVGRSRSETDRALDALLGRTPVEAAAVLTAEAAAQIGEGRAHQALRRRAV